MGFYLRYHVSMEGGFKPIETLYRGYRFRSRLEARWAVFFDTVRIPWQYEDEGYDLSNVALPNVPGALTQWLSAEDHETPDVAAPQWYLPDFYLPRQDSWIEVKPRMPDYRERLLMARLVWATGKSGYIFWQLRPPSEVLRSRLPEDASFNSALGFLVTQDPRTPYVDRKQVEWLIQCFHLGIDPEDDPPGPVVEVDFDYQWCECPRCGLVDITREGNARLLKCGCLADASTQARLLYMEDPDPVYTDDAVRLRRAYKAARQARFEHGESPGA